MVQEEDRDQVQVSSSSAYCDSQPKQAAGVTAQTHSDDRSGRPREDHTTFFPLACSISGPSLPHYFVNIIDLPVPRDTSLDETRDRRVLHLGRPIIRVDLLTTMILDYWCRAEQSSAAQCSSKKHYHHTYVCIESLTITYLTLPYHTLPWLTLPYIPYTALTYLTIPYLTSSVICKDKSHDALHYASTDLIPNTLYGHCSPLSCTMQSRLFDTYLLISTYISQAMARYPELMQPHHTTHLY